jgi:hypothetical protein
MRVNESKKEGGMSDVWVDLGENVPKLSQKLRGEDLFFDVAQASQKFVEGLGVKWPVERVDVMEIGLTLRGFIYNYCCCCVCA